MASTKTVSTGSQHTVGAGVVTSHVATGGIAAGGYSLHDTHDPALAGLHNCIWPIAIANNMAGSLTFKNGLTVMPKRPTDTGTVQVTVG